MGNLSARHIASRVGTGVLVLVLFVIWVVYYYYHEKSILKAEKFTEINAISGMKRDLVQSWQKERMAEVEFFSSTPPFTDYIESLVVGDTSVEAVFRENLAGFIHRNGYDNILLLDSIGNVIFAVYNNVAALADVTCSSVSDVFTLQDIVVQDVYYCPQHNKAHYEYVAPVKGSDGSVMAAMVFRIDPYDYLFSAIEQWHYPNSPGESYLMRFEGEDVRYITNLKERISDDLSDAGFFEGHDYANTEVLGQISKIPGTDWFLIVKFDSPELYNRMNKKVLLVVSMGFAMFLLLLGGISWLLYSRKKKTNELILREKRDEERFRRELAEMRSDLLAFSARNPLKETLRESLNRVGEFSGSPVGFVHFLEEDQNNIALTVWSEETEKQFKSLVNKGVTHNPIGKAGVWADAVRERRAVVHNDFKVVKGQKGIPEGHLEIERELVVPVIREERVVSVFAMGNKSSDYDSRDLFMASSLADTLWEISESKSREEALRQSEEKYRTLFDDHTAIKLIIDTRTGRISDVNKSAERFYGWSKEEFVTKNIKDLILFSKLTNFSSVSDFLSFKTSVTEMEHVKADGSRVVVDTFSSRIIADKREYMHVIAHDITSKHYQEKAQSILYKISRNSMINTDISSLVSFVREELQSLVDADNFYVALYNSKKDTLKKIFMVNQHYTIEEWDVKGSLSGYVLNKKSSLLLTKGERESFIDNHNIEDVPIPAEAWLGVPLISQEEAIGVVVLKNYSNAAAYDAKSLMFMEMVAHEISIAISRGLLIKDLTKAKLEAEESNKLKSSFIANISHEVKTPLNAILGFMDLVTDSSMSQEERESYTLVMKQSGNRLAKTITNLLEASKLQSGNLELNYAEIPVIEVVEYFKELYAPQAVAKGVDFKLDVEPPVISLILNTDREKLEGVIDNLLSNALKFTSKGEISLNVYKEGVNICFSVSDTGIGMSKYDLEKLFIPFYIADKTLTRNYDGTGLGMPIAKSYVEALGGEIFAESREGEGTSIIFTLPLS